MNEDSEARVGMGLYVYIYIIVKNVFIHLLDQNVTTNHCATTALRQNIFHRL